MPLLSTAVHFYTAVLDIWVLWHKTSISAAYIEQLSYGVYFTEIAAPFGFATV